VAELDLEAIRAALRESIRTRGLRPVAREVGMSPSGLMRSLAGTRPYGPTRLKLSEWYCRDDAGDRRTARDVLIDQLVERLPLRLRNQARQKIRDIVTMQA